VGALLIYRTAPTIQHHHHTSSNSPAPLVPPPAAVALVAPPPPHHTRGTHQERLAAMSIDPAEFIESLTPAVRARVEALQVRRVC
jgi:hypothetical protein